MFNLRYHNIIWLIFVKMCILSLNLTCFAYNIMLIIIHEITFGDYFICDQGYMDYGKIERNFNFTFS